MYNNYDKDLLLNTYSIWIKTVKSQVYVHEFIPSHKVKTHKVVFSIQTPTDQFLWLYGI